MRYLADQDVGEPTVVMSTLLNAKLIGFVIGAAHSICMRVAPIGTAE